MGGHVTPTFIARAICAGVLCCLLPGCVPQAENEVVIYSSLDQEFSAPILSGFVREHDKKIMPKAKFDVESTKTIGLVNRLVSEQDRVVCDVFWNNEVMHTIRLQKMGLLEPHDWQVPAGWPVIAGDKTWCGFAARARVLVVNTNLLPDKSQWPQSVMELADPKWQDQCAIAKPLFGTTATHAAVLDTIMGREKSTEFFQQVAANARVLSGNKQVAQNVALGQAAWGVTDTDDAIIEVEAGLPIAIVFPDQQPAQLGALRIPNTVAILKNSPNPLAARLLADYLVSAKTEDRLAMSDSAQIPMFPEVPTKSRVLPPGGVRWLDVDFEQAAENWDELAPLLTEIFQL
ncbi:extracellular solute-binding protein [Planctomycetaceae bacterium SH139]